MILEGADYLKDILHLKVKRNGIHQNGVHLTKMDLII